MQQFAPLSESMLNDPYVVYGELRREQPVLWHDQLGAWVLFRYADCVRVVTDIRTFSNDLAVLGESPPAEIIGLQNLDPPLHAAVRHPLLHAMRRVPLAQWVDRCLQYADKLLGERDLDRLDFVSEFAQPLSLESMRLLLGVPDFADPVAFHAAQDALVLSMDAGLDPSRGAPGVAARQYLSDLLEPWVLDPPEEGLLSSVDMPADPELHRYLVNSLRAVLVAGFLSSSSMLTCALWALLEHGTLDRSEPEAFDTVAYNELVRHSGAVQVDGRACARDVIVGGVRIPQGAEVLAVLASANRDPEAFPHADRLVLDRSPNPHLGFGRGIHACLGAGLALSLHVPLLSRLSERYRITMADAPVIRRTGTLRGCTALPLTLRPR